ncbi:MAG TPA: DnaJ C-terminal domain-containing protein [Trueperaceae bacterium]
MAEYKDYYAVLGVDRNSSQDDIRRAFRRLAAKHHPDRNPDDPGAEERFKEINEAYAVLSDPEKRRLYDAYGRTGSVPDFARAAPFGGQGTTFYTNVSPEEFAGFSDFFQSLFGSFMAGGPRAASGGVPDDPFAFGRVGSRATRPADAEARLDLGLLDAYRGGPTTIRVGDKPLEVNVPAGIRDGTKLRLRGQAPGGGDLLLQVRHLPHPLWRLDGDHLRVQVRVPDDVAALGGVVKVETLDGVVELTVPEGSSSGRVLRLRGQGWPKRGGGRGDLLAEVRVTVPETLTPEQRELYERLRAAREGRAVA